MRRIVAEAAQDDAAEGSGRLEIQVDPTSYAPFVGGLTPGARDRAGRGPAGVAGHRGGRRRDRRRVADAAPAGGAHARPAGRAPRRRRSGAGGRLRPVQRRAARRDRRSSRRRSRSPGRRAWRRCRTAASCWVPRTSRTWSATCAPTGSGTACAPREDPRVLERVVDEGVALEVCPASNVSLGVYAAPRPTSRCARWSTRGDRGARRRRPAAVPLPAGGPVRDRARRARVLRRRARRRWRGRRSGPAARRTTCGRGCSPGIDDWLRRLTSSRVERLYQCTSSLIQGGSDGQLALVRARRSPRRRRSAGRCAPCARSGRRHRRRRGSPPSGTPGASPWPRGPRSSRCRCSSPLGIERHRLSGPCARDGRRRAPARVAGIAFLAVHAGGELTWPRPAGAVRRAPLVRRRIRDVVAAGPVAGGPSACSVALLASCWACARRRPAPTAGRLSYGYADGIGSTPSPFPGLVLRPGHRPCRRRARRSGASASCSLVARRAGGSRHLPRRRRDPAPDLRRTGPRWRPAGRRVDARRLPRSSPPTACAASSRVWADAFGRGHAREAVGTVGRFASVALRGRPGRGRRAGLVAPVGDHGVAARRRPFARVAA